MVVAVLGVAVVIFVVVGVGVGVVVAVVVVVCVCCLLYHQNHHQDRVPVVSCWLLVVGCWLLVVGRWSLVVVVIVVVISKFNLSFSKDDDLQTQIDSCWH